MPKEPMLLDPYRFLIERNLKGGKPVMCGYNLRHTMIKIGEGSAPVYQVRYYIPGYGTDRVVEYKSIASAKRAMTRYDNA